MSRQVRSTYRVYRQRVGSPGTADVAYRVYLSVLTFVVLGVPVLWGTVGMLRTPHVAPSLVGAHAGSVVAFAGGALLVALAALGPIRGPALPSPWFAWTLVSNDLPRSRTLARPVVWSGTTLASASAITVALVLGSVASVDGANTRDVVVGIAAAVLFSVCATWVWLAGQVCEPRRAWLLPTGLAAALAASAWAGASDWLTPWGWLARGWPSDSNNAAAWIVLGLLAAVAVASGLGMIWLLRLVRGPQLVEQASRWSAATDLATMGDLAAGAGTMRVMPTRGRARAALGPGWAGVRYLRADTVAAARTPVRSAVGLLFLTAGAWIVAGATSSEHIPAWIIGAVGALVAYAGAGPLTDGVRHGAASVKAPCLFGHGRAALMGLRLPLPLCASLAAAAVGSMAAHTLAGVIAAAGVSLSVVGLRAVDALKGPIPVEILTPVNTPLGDTSGIGILAWQSDAVICAAVAGAVICAATGSAALAVAASAVVVGVVAAVALSRLNADS